MLDITLLIFIRICWIQPIENSNAYAREGAVERFFPGGRHKKKVSALSHVKVSEYTLF